MAPSSTVSSIAWGRPQAAKYRYSTNLSRNNLSDVIEPTVHIIQFSQMGGVQLSEGGPSLFRVLEKHIAHT